jgi:hypothetical protein
LINLQSIENIIMNITSTEYREELKSLAADIVAEHEDYAEAHDLVHETIDGHQWIIYTAYNNDIVQISDNHDAYLDVYNQEDLGQIVMDKGIDGLTLTRAFFAMSQDLNDAIHEITSEQ